METIAGEFETNLDMTLDSYKNPTAGKYFPSVLEGQGGMVLLTDGGPDGMLTPFLSSSPGNMEVMSCNA